MAIGKPTLAPVSLAVALSAVVFVGDILAPPKVGLTVIPHFIAIAITAFGALKRHVWIVTGIAVVLTGLGYLFKAADYGASLFLFNRACIMALLIAMGWFATRLIVYRRQLSDDVAAREVAKSTSEQERQFRDFAEVSSDWFWETDAEHRITYMSRTSEKVTGYKVEEHIGKARTEVAGMDPISEDWKQHLAAIENRREFRNFVYRRLGPTGQILYISTSGKPIYDENGVFVGYRGVARDVTAERTAQIEIETAKERYDLAVRHAAIWDWDLKQDQVFFSPQWCVYLGYSEAEFQKITAESIARLIHPDDREQYLATLRYHIERPGTLYESEHRFQTKTGDYRWFYARGQALADDTGTPARMVGIIVDISKQKDAEAQKAQALDAADRANNSKSEFLANMSHELRTPLNSIIGFSDVLSQEMFGRLGNTRYVEYSKDIRGAALHLLSLINELLDISKIEADQMSLRERILPLAEIVDGAMGMLKGTESPESAEILDMIGRSEITLRCDERMMKQVLINLLSNALKFTPSDGTIRLLTRDTEDGGVRIIVEDTGIGIPVEEISRLFTPFGQVDSAAHVAKDGTGLGLYLSKRIMELHGGDLSIESHGKGTGTIATCTLPAWRRVTGDGGMNAN